MNRTLILLVFGGLAVVHVMATVGEWLIRRGALELERDKLDRVWAREARLSSIWKGSEMLALAVMAAGLLKAWGIIKGAQPWGIPAIAIGFGLFCASSILRAWMCSAAYSSEAPGSKASRGALMAGILTTLAECAVGFAVCKYIYKHFDWPSKTPSQSTHSTMTSTATPVSTGTSISPNPSGKSEYVNESEALQLMPGKDAKYLRTLAQQSWIRSRKTGADLEYHRDDIVKQKAAGWPGPEELETRPVAKPEEPDKTEPDKSEKVEP